MASYVSGTQQGTAETLNSAKYSQQGLDPYKSEPKLLGPSYLCKTASNIFLGFVKYPELIANLLCFLCLDVSGIL